MRHALFTCAGLLTLAACAPSAETAQTPPPAPADPAALSIDDVFGSVSLTGATPRGLRFSPDGERVTFLRPKADDRTVTDLWAMNLSDGQAYMLVDSAVLAPDERELSEAEIQYRERARISTSGVVSYDWDETGDAILVPLDGDVFYVNVDTGEAERLMQTEAFETDARVSPDGQYVSFIRDQNLWVHNLESGEGARPDDRRRRCDQLGRRRVRRPGRDAAIHRVLVEPRWPLCGCRAH